MFYGFLTLPAMPLLIWVHRDIAWECLVCPWTTWYLVKVGLLTASVTHSHLSFKISLLKVLSPQDRKSHLCEILIHQYRTALNVVCLGTESDLIKISSLSYFVRHSETLKISGTGPQVWPLPVHRPFIYMTLPFAIGPLLVSDNVTSLKSH